MKLSFEVLETLDAIDRAGTFAGAAEWLHRVPSALSYQVQKLETDLGVALFDRSGRRARFTHAGRVLVEEGRRLLQRAEELERKAKRVHRGWEPELRICIDEILPLDAMWAFIREFYEMNMDTRLHLSREALAGTWDALVNRRADIVVGAAGDLPPMHNLVARPIGSMKHVFAVSPGHPLAQHQEPLTLETISRYRCAIVGDTSKEPDSRSGANAIARHSITLPTLDSQLSAQIEGLAVGVLPECVAAAPIEQGRLIEKTVSGLPPATHYYLAWREDEGGPAMRWWIERLDRPDLMSHLIARDQVLA
ncbi:LysR substrate-binding domain-containing protein [Paraburkholderia caballeronis]|uniref:DNA-binding transcriptional regulator, LysR family n=1 Tax=Paraburkholderia caballeronis TaxID=416943 RepID=A0A1H7L5H2_9BURK|nr:LysR substrate-binding domain-containing protein [Paraburkholderia caballeronis]PXW28302.1 LysR family transcriptional regulator [Paraburkholderia caballeronis]PXX03668.1 LysR family transcriptional regulator [Paraburkholderia caballeronis]RAK04412.1 LysR family transcriptional regulator [Paraburkholderia caballeronis]SED81222.1 transcriptional regulator, LysR family [Paraburkholderia caballeronis]SEK94208.1 DNA-binding transcriptional regulator, LysR family [Paraburkholderia caballeronis]